VIPYKLKYFPKREIIDKILLIYLEKCDFNQLILFRCYLRKLRSLQAAIAK